MYTSLKKIMVPTDNSENSADAFKIALDFAEKHGASVHVLHVVHTSYLTEAHKHEPHLFLNYPHTYEKNLIEERKTKTDEFIKKHKGDRTGVTVEVEIREGDPVQEILRAAKEKGIDMIVIGTHGRKGLARAVMGSVTEKIVREASCPVLTVKRKEAAHKAA